MEEKKIVQDQETKTEEDRQVEAILSKVPVKKTLTILFVFALNFIVIETYFIWRVLSVEGIHRLTTMNGSVVIIGGLLWACIFTLVFVWPMKLLNIEGLRLTYKMQKGMQDAKEWADRELKPMILELKGLITDAKDLKPFIEDVKQVFADMKEIVSAFKERDFSKVEHALTEIEKAIGKNGDLQQALQGLASFKESFGDGVAQFREVAKFFDDMRKKIDNPDFKAKVAHAAKTLDALADYLDLRVG